MGNVINARENEFEMRGVLTETPVTEQNKGWNLCPFIIIFISNACKHASPRSSSLKQLELDVSEQHWLFLRLVHPLRNAQCAIMRSPEAASESSRLHPHTKWSTIPKLKALRRDKRLYQRLYAPLQMSRYRCMQDNARVFA